MKNVGTFVYMGNNRNRESFFRFKEFSVRDSAGAMKIGTDGVLLGAWVPVSGIERAVDVGCGTGLISLMLAQRGVAQIYGIEISDAAAKEAESNVSESIFANNIQIIAGDATEMELAGFKPQLIVSNPPFFADSLKCGTDDRTTARHEGSLSFDNLIKLSAGALDCCGMLAFISPADREKDIDFAAVMHRMYVARKTFVRTVPGKSPKRILWLLSKPLCETRVDSLQIRNESGEYSNDYINLTKDFYLHL